MASLVHDDLIDGAELRRGRASVWSAYGPEAARAGGVYLFARAFAELAATRDGRAVSILADAADALVRGEVMERGQRRRPETTVDEYLTRCTLKTAKLFEAACLISSGEPQLGEFGLALGIAFQIVDDCLDCAGQTVETGKIAGRTCARESQLCLSCSRRGRTRSCAPRWPAARSTARCCASPGRARSKRRGRSRARTSSELARASKG